MRWATMVRIGLDLTPIIMTNWFETNLLYVHLYTIRLFFGNLENNKENSVLE